MLPYFEFSTTPKANKINQSLEAGTIRGTTERAFDKQKTYIMCVPVSVIQARMTQVNASDEDEDVTWVLQRTGEDVYFTLSDSVVKAPDVQRKGRQPVRRAGTEL